MFSLLPNTDDEKPISTLVHSGILDAVEGDGFNRAVWQISKVLELPVSLITLLNGEKFWIRSDIDISAEEIVESLVGFHEAIPAQGILEINDAMVDPSFFDSPIVARHGGVRFFAGAPITDSSGFPCGVVTVLDMRPRKLDQDERTMLRCFADQIENEIKLIELMQEESNLRFEVSKAFNAKSTFLSQMSHEIRIPIAGIIGATDLLLSDAATGTQEPRELLKTIRTSASDLLQLLNETLDSAKIEAGGLHIESVPMDLRQFRDKLERHFHPLAENKSLTFSVDLNIPSEEPELIYSDPLRLRQLLFNITHNAMKFTESGGVAVSINVEPVSENQSMLKLQVKDTGIGMSPEAKASLFEPFRQGNEGDERSHEGTGLGMSLVKQLVERMGGDIDVHSEPGNGTCIAINLSVQPVNDVWVVASNDDTDDQAQTQLDDVASSGKVEGMQVLVADDNPQNRLILEKVITSWGCDVTTTDDGQSALELALAHAFDAIVLDLHMPRKSGFEVAREIRNYTSSTRLIACSADTTHAAYAKCQDAGFDSQIEKPFNWPKLYEALSARKVALTEHCDADEVVGESLAS